MNKGIFLYVSVFTLKNNVGLKDLSFGRKIFQSWSTLIFYVLKIERLVLAASLLLLLLLALAIILITIFLHHSLDFFHNTRC